ncbi:hypothetical protein [Paenibacillus sp. 1A_MP2]|uniref:hypothetical protein n=1 Tax=Paenibacillus sp. 1A_MP2 TaxID=3457495 RepID=UPI003FCD46F2
MDRIRLLADWNLMTDQQKVAVLDFINQLSKRLQDAVISVMNSFAANNEVFAKNVGTDSGVQADGRAACEEEAASFAVSTEDITDEASGSEPEAGSLGGTESLLKEEKHPFLSNLCLTGGG